MRLPPSMCGLPIHGQCPAPGHAKPGDGETLGAEGDPVTPKPEVGKNPRGGLTDPPPRSGGGRGAATAKPASLAMRSVTRDQLGSRRRAVPLKRASEASERGGRSPVTQRSGGPPAVPSAAAVTAWPVSWRPAGTPGRAWVCVFGGGSSPGTPLSAAWPWWRWSVALVAGLAAGSRAVHGPPVRRPVVRGHPPWAWSHSSGCRVYGSRRGGPHVWPRSPAAYGRLGLPSSPDAASGCPAG